jgi:hypothetical protein
MQGRRPFSVKKNIVAKSKEAKTGSNLADSSKESYDLKRAALPMMMMTETRGEMDVDGNATLSQIRVLVGSYQLHTHRQKKRRRYRPYLQHISFSTSSQLSSLLLMSSNTWLNHLLLDRPVGFLYLNSNYRYPCCIQTFRKAGES